MEDYESTYAANIARQKGSNAYTEYCLDSINQRRAMVNVDNMSGSGEERFSAFQNELKQGGCKSAFSYSMLRFHLGVMQSGDYSLERRISVCYGANLFINQCDACRNHADSVESKLQQNHGCIGRFMELAYSLSPGYSLANAEIFEPKNPEMSASSRYIQYIMNGTTELLEHLAGENMRLQSPIDREVLNGSISLIDDSFMLYYLGIDLGCTDFIRGLVKDCPKG